MNLFWNLFGGGLAAFLSLAGLALVIKASLHAPAGSIFDDNWLDEEPKSKPKRSK